MAYIDDIDRRALGILSETLNAELGVRTLVSREVRRAFVSGRSVDMFSASKVFNNLPGKERRRIGNVANDRAFRIVRSGIKNTERDWKDIENDSRSSGANRQSAGSRNPVFIEAPPKFLRPRSR